MQLPLESFVSATENAIASMEKPLNGNLILSRKEGEKVRVMVGDETLVITVIMVERGRAKLAFNGSRETFAIVRDEINTPIGEKPHEQ